MMLAKWPEALLKWATEATVRYPSCGTGVTPTVLNAVSGFTRGALASGINSHGLIVGTDYFSETGAGRGQWLL
jgi:hypothetical protein